MSGTLPFLIAVLAGTPPYADFVQRHRSHVHAVSRRRLEVEMHDMQAAPAPLALGLSAPQLRVEVADALNIRFLLDRIATASIDVLVRERHERSPYVEEHVVLRDEALGSLDASVLLPRDGMAVHPGIVGLHGHGDRPADFLRRDMGAELARDGYVVVVPWSRAMECGEEEKEVSLRLLRAGFTLMGLRVYEALLAIRYLRDRPDVDPRRIAIVGHSGGSSTANLVVRLTDWLAAQISDHEVEYRDLCDGRVHCETVPALFRLAADINDHGTLSIPYLHVPYGFSDRATRGRMLSFLGQALHEHPARTR